MMNLVNLSFSLALMRADPCTRISQFKEDRVGRIVCAVNWNAYAMISVNVLLGNGDVIKGDFALCQ